MAVELVFQSLVEASVLLAEDSPLVEALAHPLAAELQVAELALLVAGLPLVEA